MLIWEVFLDKIYLKERKLDLAKGGVFLWRNMKEIELNKNIQPNIPEVFAKSFTYGFSISVPETEINQIIGDINREFIVRRLRHRDYIDHMNA